MPNPRATTAPITFRDAEARSALLQVMLEPGKFDQIRAANGSRRNAVITFVRQSIDLALAEHAAGRRPPEHPRPPGAETRTKHVNVRVTPSELYVLRSATEAGTDMQVKRLIRWGIDLKLAGLSPAKAPARRASRA